MFHIRGPEIALVSGDLVQQRLAGFQRIGQAALGALHILRHFAGNVLGILGAIRAHHLGTAKNVVGHLALGILGSVLCIRGDGRRVRQVGTRHRALCIADGVLGSVLCIRGDGQRVRQVGTHHRALCIADGVLGICHLP